MQDQCCIFCSIPAGTDGKSRTGMQTGTRYPHVPPRLKFWPISAYFGRFGLFRPVSAGLLIPAGILFGFYFLGFQFSVPNLILISRSLGLFSALISQSLLSLLITPPVRLHGSTSCLQLQPSSLQPATKPPPAVQLQPSTVQPHHSRLPLTTSKPICCCSACRFLVSPFQICLFFAVAALPLCPLFQAWIFDLGFFFFLLLLCAFSDLSTVSDFFFFLAALPLSVYKMMFLILGNLISTNVKT